jgi:hypothetical protein
VITGRVKRWFVAGFSLIVLACVPLMVADGNGAAAALVMAPFGLGGLVVALVRVPRDPLAEATVDVDGRPERALVAAGSLAAQRAGVMGCGLFALAGVGIAVAGESALVGVACALLFAAVALVGLGRGALRRPGALAVAESALVWRRPGGAETIVPWEAVGEVERVETRVRGSRVAEHLGLRLALPALVRGELTPLDRGPSGTDLAVPLAALRAEPDAVEDAVREALRRARAGGR